MAGSEQRARGDDAIAAFQMGEQRRVHRRHAGGGGQAGFGAFEQREPALEHRHGRVAEARILIVADAAVEGGFGLLGAVVDEARGEEQRLGGLSEVAALGAAMHQQGGGAVAGCGVAHRGAFLQDGPTIDAQGCARVRGAAMASLARLFHLAAIRPDKSRGPASPAACTLEGTSLRGQAGAFIHTTARV